MHLKSAFIALAVILVGCSTPAEKQSKEVEAYLSAVSQEMKESVKVFSNKFRGRNIAEVARMLDLDMKKAWTEERGDLIVPFEEPCSINVRIEAGTNLVAGLHVPTKEEVKNHGRKWVRVSEMPIYRDYLRGVEYVRVTYWNVPDIEKKDYFASVGKCDRFISLMKQYR